MPLKVRHTTAARRDLRELWRYIARENASAADSLLRRIGDKTRLLASQPAAGRQRPELGPVRSTPVDRYVIFYRVDADTLHVVRVLSAYRNITPDMLSE